MPTFRIDGHPPAEVYKLLVSAVVPRPIAWVSTLSEEGIANLAPYSFFNVASIDPPVLMFAPQMAPTSTQGQPDGGARTKDTLANLRATRECVVHVVPHALADAMNQTSAAWPADTSEFEACGLTPVPSEGVAPPRVAEAPVAFEAVLDRIVSFGDGPRAGQAVFVRIALAHLADEATANGRYADTHLLDPVGRLGGTGYVRVKDGVFDLERPSLEVRSEK
ncbi:MAG: flavin reductase family protein [Bacteroidota bacterium]